MNPMSRLFILALLATACGAPPDRGLSGTWDGILTSTTPTIYLETTIYTDRWTISSDKVTALKSCPEWSVSLNGVTATWSTQCPSWQFTGSMTLQDDQLVVDFDATEAPLAPIHFTGLLKREDP